MHEPEMLTNKLKHQHTTHINKTAIGKWNSLQTVDEDALEFTKFTRKWSIRRNKRVENKLFMFTEKKAK